ncbi:hypothetical protein PSCICJ_39600 [Pseudomonas cichorii]|nr:hypothetical protein PSCICJ_39600 [Pseudomonas cichorii]
MILDNHLSSHFSSLRVPGGPKIPVRTGPIIRTHSGKLPQYYRVSKFE